jgi:hypothetical protein
MQHQKDISLLLGPLHPLFVSLFERLSYPLTFLTVSKTYQTADDPAEDHAEDPKEVILRRIWDRE